MSIQVKFETTILEGAKETKIITDYGDSIFSGLNVVEKYINLYLRKYVLPWYKVDNTFVISTDVALKITDNDGDVEEVLTVIPDTELMFMRIGKDFKIPFSIVEKIISNNNQENVTSCIINAIDVLDGGTLNLNITNLFNTHKVLYEIETYSSFITSVKQMLKPIPSIRYELVIENEGNLCIYHGEISTDLFCSKLENDPIQYVDLIGELVTEMKKRSTEM